MRIIFSQHAENRLYDRKISKLEIITTIKNPQEVEESFRERTLQRRKFGKKTLEVITKVEKSSIIVISAYYLGGINYES